MKNIDSPDLETRSKPTKAPISKIIILMSIDMLAMIPTSQLQSFSLPTPPPMSSGLC